MYISLLNINFYTFSFDFYHNVKSKIDFYVKSRNEKTIMLYISNFIIDKILLDRGKSDKTEILRFYFYKNPNLDHLIFNMYSILLQSLESLKLKSNAMYSLNTLSKYNPKDLFKIEPSSLYTGVTSWLKVNTDNNAITIKFYELMSLDRNDIIKEKSNLKELIDHFHKNEDFLSSYKNIKSKDLENIVLSMLHIFIKLKDVYLIEFDLKDVISLFDNKSNSRYDAILYADMFFFYHSGNIVINVGLLIRFTGPVYNYEKTAKFFISLDNILCYYKDVTNQIKIKSIEDRDIYDHRKNIMKSKYLVRKRSNKIML